MGHTYVSTTTELSTQNTSQKKARRRVGSLWDSLK